MASSYDLSGTLCAHFDPHLALTVIEFLQSRGGIDGVEDAKLRIVEKTNMVDYAIDLYQERNGGSEEVRRLSCSGQRSVRISEFERRSRLPAFFVAVAARPGPRSSRDVTKMSESGWVDGRARRGRRIAVRTGNPSRCTLAPLTH